MQLICGINPVLEALLAGARQFDRLLVVKGLRNRRVSDAIARASHIGVPLRFETREALDRLSAGVPHQGVIAVVSPKPVMGLHELLAAAREPALVVVLDGIEDPRNLGAIVRTVEAAGADGVLLPERHSAGLSETVSRASAGALDHVKVARIGNVSQTLDELKERGLWVIGLDAEGERWDTLDFKRPVAIVLGSEGRGLRRLVRERCDQLAGLPLFGQVSSLNVSVAAGAVLYEVVRQRGAVPSHVRPIPPSARPAPSISGPAPDDTEVDPGYLGPTGSVEVEAEDDAQASNLSLVQIHEGEEPAWRLPPEPSPAERRGASRVRGDAPAGPSGPREPREPRERRGDDARPPDADRGGRGRNKRRRRRPGGRPDGRPEGRGEGRGEARTDGRRDGREPRPDANASQPASNNDTGGNAVPPGEGPPAAGPRGDGHHGPPREGQPRRRGRRRRRGKRPNTTPE